MERYLNFAHQTETRNREEIEKKCLLVLKQLVKLTDLKFNFKSSNTYLHIITTILLSFDYLQYRDLLIQLLKQNNVDERGLLLHLLAVMNQFESTLSFDADRNKWITSFSTLPIHQDIAWDNEKIRLKTKYGNFEVYRYDQIVARTDIYEIILTRTLANYCHSNVGQLKKYFPNAYIVTSEIPTLFGSYMYHSYYETNDGTIDISNNIFYPNNDFNRIFLPNEILKIKTDEFEEQYRKLVIEKNIYENNSVAPVLVMALNNKMKK